MVMLSPRLLVLPLAVALSSLKAQQGVPPLVAPAAAPAPRVAPPAPGQLEAAPAAPLPPPTALPPRPDLPGEVPRVAPPRPRATSSTSTSGQFIVHGDDLALRSAFSSKCEDISEELRKLLRDNKPWSTPIVILLNSGESAMKASQPVVTSVSQIDHGGFHLQVTIHLRPDLRQSEARREIVRALLAERILRDQKEIKAKRPLLLPDWLFTGILEALDYRSRTRPSTLFAAIFKSGRIYGIEEIIQASPVAMDALSRTIYQTSCCALVLALLDQPDGGLRMAKFLSALASDPRSERELLDQQFPAIAGSPSSLNKWWSLQLATLASPTLSEPMSIDSTLEQLDHALTFRYRAKPAEIPRPRPVVARTESPKPAATAPQPKAEPPAVVETTQTERPKRSFLSRLNPFSRSRRENPDEVIAAALEEVSVAGVTPEVEEDEEESSDEAPTKATAPVKAKVAAAQGEPQESAEATAEKPYDKRSFLRRLFSWAGKQPKRDEAASKTGDAAAMVEAPVTIITNEPMPGEEPVAEAKPASPSPDEPTPEANPAKKPTILNPLNWFRRGKTPNDSDSPESDDAPAAETPEKTGESAQDNDNSASATPRTTAWLAEVGAVTGQPVLVMDFFGLRKGRKTPEEPKPEEPTEAPAKAEEKPAAKAEEKPAAKADVKPVEAEPKAADKKADATSETPPAEEAPAEADKDESPRKRSLFRRLLWGDSSKEADKTEETEASKKDASKPDEAGKEEPKKDAPKKESPQSAAAKPEASKPEPVPSESPAMPVVKPAAPRPEALADGLVAAEVALEDYAAVLKRPDAKTILDGNIRELAALQNRAAILFRPVVTEASKLLGDLSEGRTKGMDARIRELRRRIREAETRSRAVRDLLDLHEANEPLFMSGVFEDYLKLPETLQKELPERTDPIARYLDALEREFSRE